MLGLSNLRSALQALQLRESMIRTNCFLRWLASDYDLGDALTKKRPDCRTGLLKYLKTKLWCVAFDPTFTAAKKNAKKGHTAVSAIDGLFTPGCQVVRLLTLRLHLSHGCVRSEAILEKSQCCWALCAIVLRLGLWQSFSFEGATA